MTFSSEEEQIKRFEEDMVAQDYIAVLRALIAKKSIFAQQVGLQEVAAYLKEIFIKAGAEVEFSLPPPCFLLPNWLIQTV